MMIFIFQCLYFLLPAALAILTPQLVAHFKILENLNRPVDGGKTLSDGKRILGDHKTIRGFIIGTLTGVLAAFIQYILSANGWLIKYSLFDYSQLFPSLFLGFLLGFGALFGDAIKSFFKRRLNIMPGSSLFLFDQTDFILGAFIFSLPLIVLPLRFFFGSLIIYFFVHIITTGIGVLTGVKKSWI